MYNFEFQNPVKLIFGKGSIARIAEEIPAQSKIMLTFGGGSVKRNGVYDQVIKALEGRNVVEFWGIEPNPKYETLVEAIALARREGVDFLLAVGGGSVIDGTKFIAAAIPYEGEPWDIITRNDIVRKAVPLATVLTLPATGSEMNNGAVISRRTTHEKFPFHSDLVFPRFSVLDPCVTFSLPKKMIAAGLADTFVHVMEQYMTYPVDARVMDRWAEGLLQTVMERSYVASRSAAPYGASAMTSRPTRCARSSRWLSKTLPDSHHTNTPTAYSLSEYSFFCAAVPYYAPARLDKRYVCRTFVHTYQKQKTYSDK